MFSLLSRSRQRLFSQSSRMMSALARVKQQAPAFKATAVINQQFHPISLADYRDKKWVLLFFYPLDFTFVCPTEIVAFSDKSADFEKIQCQVLGCSVDSEFSHLAWIKQPRNQGGLGDMKIPLLSDLNKQISKDYGVLVEDGSVALRGMFIIDPKGINDLPVGRSVDEALRLVKALQFTDKHGDVCPANWNEGSATMKADVKGSQEYFKNVK